jgi:hypothetical protein
MPQYIVVITSDKDYSVEAVGPFADEATAEDYIANDLTLAPRTEAEVVELDNPGE